MTTETKKAMVKSIVFYNAENGYTVAGMEEEGAGAFTAVGSLPGARAGMRYEITGEWRVHPRFGKQFAVRQYAELTPDSDAGIELFLSSGAIKGVGPKMARLIVEAFGKETLEIIEKRPEKLMSLPGIGRKKCESIRESFLDQREFADTVLYFRQFDISPTAALKLYKEYGGGAIEAVKENPYRMIDDIFGVGFRTADSIAMKMGISGNDPERIKSGIIYVLNRYAGDGSAYVPAGRLKEHAIQLMDVTGDEIEDQIFSMVLDGTVEQKLIDGVEAVFLSAFYYAETGVCKDLLRLERAELKELRADSENLIGQTELRSGVTLSEKQKEAVKSSLASGVFVITGGPGTGKTTIINSIMDIFSHCGLETSIAAPTGRAAKRITETTGFKASTIHRLLEYAYTGVDDDMFFGKDRSDPLDCDAVIIDEASMVDILLMKALLAAIPSGARLIMVGDADQLPPVGVGNVLRDMIESGRIASARLTEIFRQAEESMIVVNAHRINRGDYPQVNEEDSDFFLLHKKTESEILDTLKDLCVRRLPEHYEGLDPVKDIQILTPVKKGILGNANLNRSFQAIFNPPSPEKDEKSLGERVFRVGDKVMQTKNNYRLRWINRHDFSEGDGVFNGDMGYIESIDEDKGDLTVIFDDVKYAIYDFASLDELEHAYAITIHKSQGSEFPVALIPIFPVAPVLSTRNLIYTAVTRGKKLVALVGSESRLRFMVDNNQHKERYSALKSLLVQYFEEII